MFKHPGRLIGGLFALCMVGVAALIIVTNLRTAALERDVRSGKPDDVRSALQQRPELARLKLLAQGSRSSSIGARTSNDLWRGRYIIHDVVSDGNVSVASVLAEFGADLSVRLDGQSLLHLATQNRHLEMIRWLVGKGANVNDRIDCKDCEQAGQTPLHIAGGASEVLLSLGADVRAADAAGRTALHVTQSTEKATMLCAYGADVHQRDRSGSTAFDLAQRIPADKQDKPGQLADWIRPGGGCERLAARVRRGIAPNWDEVWAAYRQYVCERGQSPELRDCPKKP